MNLFDIMGPVMVGPSSSHTAGAVKIGYTAMKLLKEPVKKADILLHGSFLLTGKGHGTPQALLAGVLGMQTDDERIPKSEAIARERGIEYSFGAVELKDAHANSVLLRLEGESGKHIEVVGESLGGSRINIAQVNGHITNFSGEYNTLIVNNADRPGCVAEISSLLERENVNIAQMKLNRESRGGHAIMVFECDQEISKEALSWIEKQPGIERVIYYSLNS